MITDQLIVARIGRQTWIDGQQVETPAEAGPPLKVTNNAVTTGVGRNNGFCWKIESPLG